MMRLSSVASLLLLVATRLLSCGAFHPALLSTRRRGVDHCRQVKELPVTSSSPIPTTGSTTASASRLFAKLSFDSQQQQQQDVKVSSTQAFLTKLRQRFDTLQSAGIANAQTAGGIWSRIKRLYDPITFIVVFAIAGFRMKWCFRNPYYWFAVGFCIKWYRARYVFKIPVWDRQPNWNNIITSKEQEKDLKAFTCKQCGSTLFIAKTREFFFEGNTGIGGLGCFSCGAKGKENFVMDRDRIVEDVADMDDYFEYEKPLDFVSRAERRKILKETKGDEDLANKILLERQGTSQPNGSDDETVVDAEVTNAEESISETSEESEAIDAEGKEASPEAASNESAGAEDKDAETSDHSQAAAVADEKERLPEISSPEAATESSDTLNGSPSEKEDESSPTPDPPKVGKKPKKKKKAKTATAPSPPQPVSDEEMFDALDMDAF